MHKTLKSTRIYNPNNANIYKIVLKGLLNFAKYYYTHAFQTQLIKAYNDAIDNDDYKFNQEIFWEVRVNILQSLAETKKPKNQSESDTLMYKIYVQYTKSSYYPKHLGIVI